MVAIRWKVFAGMRCAFPPYAGLVLPLGILFLPQMNANKRKCHDLICVYSRSFAAKSSS